MHRVSKSNQPVNISDKSDRKYLEFDAFLNAETLEERQGGGANKINGKIIRVVGDSRERRLDGIFAKRGKHHEAFEKVTNGAFAAVEFHASAQQRSGTVEHRCARVINFHCRAVGDLLE